MGVYTPAAVVPVTSLTAVGGTSLLTGTNGLQYIIRTIHVNTGAAGKTVTFSVGADAAGKRLLDAYPLVTNVPYVLNGWYTFSGSGAAHDLDGNCSATTVVLMASGCTFA